MDIQKFIERFKHTFVYELLSKTITDEQLFEHVIDKDGAPIWFKDQTRQMWFMWQAAKAQAVPEGFVLVPKEPTEKMLEAGYQDSFDAKGHEIKDIYKAMIEAQEQSHD